MVTDIICKKPEAFAVQPNMKDYAETSAQFSWAKARGELAGLPDGRGLNIAYEAVDRHAAGPEAEHTALRWLAKDGRVWDFSYSHLRDQSNRFANWLQRLGIQKGDRVFALAGRIPELYVAALGTLKFGAVFCPLFSAFGPEPLRQRLEIGNARVLVTTQRLYGLKVAALASQLPDLQYVFLSDATSNVNSKVLSMPVGLRDKSEQFRIPDTSPDDLALLHFTSGTTGKPKGAMHVHNAAVMHYVTGKYVLDFHPDDIFWCTADPGWVTGTSYGIISPLLHGVTILADELEFDPERWFTILQDRKVTIWYTAPTAIRMLMRAAPQLRRRFDLSHLRFIASVGEPLNAEAVRWGQDELGIPIHDNWWQTETGGIMIANYPAMDIRPGSMGKPVPGVEAGIVRGVDEGKAEVVKEPDAIGHLALRPGWPSMFRGYLHDEERYRKCFIDGWYITGDLARRDKDGYYWFAGRADDIIKTAGHMVGPFEVESVLMSHEAVSEAGVIGKPDPVIGAIVKAFVVLKPGFVPTEDLRLELLGFARTKLGSAIAPKEIEFSHELPHTRSAKIMRRLLRARELGLPEGDTSTLETTE